MKPTAFVKQTITGILIPQQWDDEGTVIGVSVQTFDESEFIVKDCRLAKELFDFINQTVKVTGKVSVQPDGKQFIAVNQYKVMERLNTD